MEISEPSISIFFMSKILALAPYSVRKNSKGVYVIQKSIPFLFYASTITIILVSLIYHGLLFDVNPKVSIRESDRMKSATSKVVTILDVSMIVMAITAGVVCGIVGLNATRDLNARLRKVDDSLGSMTDFKMERSKSILILVLPMAAMAILMVVDVNTWLQSEVAVHYSDVNVQWYIPVYSLYFILTGLHINIANTSLGLARRFESVNFVLRHSYLPAKCTKTLQNPERVKITEVKTTTFDKVSLQESLSKSASEAYQNSTKNKVMLLKMLAECHESLGICMDIVSSAYGMAILFILISCFLHLVATSYFLFTELLSKEAKEFVWLHVLWILFHSCRLLMVVEPCHRITRASTKTIRIICEIERTVRDPILAEEVKTFWQQLLVFDSEFSACGLCCVNRQLLTSASLVSAIVTYLVILIQFQKCNG